MVVVKLQSGQFLRAPVERIGSRRRGRGIIRCGIAEASGEPAPLGQKTKYSDGAFEKVFMTLFARKMEKFSKEEKKKKGKWWDLYDYESFVDASKRVMQGRNRVQQQQVVRQVLLSMLPPGAPAQVRISKSVPPKMGTNLILYLQIEYDRMVLFHYYVNYELSALTMQLRILNRILNRMS